MEYLLFRRKQAVKTNNLLNIVTAYVQFYNC